MDIYKKVLDEHKVTEEEGNKLLASAGYVLHKLQDEINRNEIDAEVMLGGSAAKGTFVKGDFDCDVFIRFEKKYIDDQLSEMLEHCLKIFQGVNRVHGSRDYFQAKIDNIDFEFVPVKKISNPNEALNVTDSSPLHVQWMKKNIEINPELIDQIILTKLFCKAARVYGAESYIRGFSGHVIDILLAYYKTFENLLKNSLEWKKGDVIDVESHGTSQEMNASKINSLIVIDPIQPERNAAAALNMENVQFFQKKACEFLQKPSCEFFKKKPLTKEYLESIKDGNSLFIIMAEPLEGKDDVVGAKILKVFEYIKKQLKAHDFEVVQSGWEWDKKNDAMLYFLVNPEILSEFKLREGPPVKVTENASKFRELHPDAWEENGRLYANVKRDFTSADKLIEHLISNDYIKEKVKSIRSISQT